VSHVQPEYQKRKFSAAREFIRKSGGEIVAPESLESFRSPQELVSFMRAARKSQLPQAVFCENDISAIELHSIIASQDSPHGIQIIGCDGVIPFKAIWSVKIDIGATAAAAAELFEKSLDGQDMPESLPKITTEPIFN
jgi:DNA-binding LacI/PurR family transcriptional regulator